MTYDLFSLPALPAQPTSTQLDAADVIGPHVETIESQVLGDVRSSRTRGRTPKEVARNLMHDVVTVRARLTTLHQRGQLLRTLRVVNREHLYVCPEFWHPMMGNEPSKPHKGRK